MWTNNNPSTCRPQSLASGQPTSGSSRVGHAALDVQIDIASSLPFQPVTLVFKDIKCVGAWAGRRL